MWRAKGLSWSVIMLDLCSIILCLRDLKVLPIYNFWQNFQEME